MQPAPYYAQQAPYYATMQPAPYYAAAAAPAPYDPSQVYSQHGNAQSGYAQPYAHSGYAQSYGYAQPYAAQPYYYSAQQYAQYPQQQQMQPMQPMQQPMQQQQQWTGYAAAPASGYGFTPSSMPAAAPGFGRSNTYPAAFSSAPHTQQPAPPQRSTARPCKLGAQCTRPDCWYSHPEGHNPQAVAAAAAEASAAAAAAAPAPPPVDPAAPWRSQSKVAVWKQYPREDSFGALIVAHVDPTVQLDYAALRSTPLHQLRFLLVQRQCTSAWQNLLNELQEAPWIPGARTALWRQREAERLTNNELDTIGRCTFDELWNDSTKWSATWRVDFHDANAEHARQKYWALQDLADTIRETRAASAPRFSVPLTAAAPTDPHDLSDDSNLSKLNLVIPKGQLATLTSLARLPHLIPASGAAFAVDASPLEGAAREVHEETGLSPGEFRFLPLDLCAPLVFANFPPKKVEIYLATLDKQSEHHPARMHAASLAQTLEQGLKEASAATTAGASMSSNMSTAPVSAAASSTSASQSSDLPSVIGWPLPPNPETRRCVWMSLEEILHYFRAHRISASSYTHTCITQLQHRFQWFPPFAHRSKPHLQQQQQPQQAPLQPPQLRQQTE